MTETNPAGRPPQPGRRFGPRVAIRSKRHGLFHDLPWAALREQVTACAAALVRAGVGAGDRVSVFAENRVEWIVADMGILLAGAVNVPLHAPLTAPQAPLPAGRRGRELGLRVERRPSSPRCNRSARELSACACVVCFDGAADGATGWRRSSSTAGWPRAEVQDELDRREAALTGRRPGDDHVHPPARPATPKGSCSRTGTS